MKKHEHSTTYRLLLLIFLCSLSKVILADDTTPQTWEDLAQEPEGWSTSSTEINITSAAELAWVAKMVNGGTQTGVSPSDKGFLGVTITLSQEIDLAGYEWIPIGKHSRNTGDTDMFQGTFDGNEKAIKNMNISTGYTAGLFGHINQAIIKNVNLVDCTIEKVYDNMIRSPQLNLYVGGIAGKSSNKSTIEHCSVKGNITYPKAEGGYLGGITGRNDDGGTIKNCHFEGSLSSTWSEKNLNSASIGGITAQNLQNGIIEGCTAKIDITSENGETGGITCTNSHIIQDCHTQGKITITTNRINYGVGGIATNNNIRRGAEFAIKGCSSSCDIHMTYIANSDNTSQELRYAKVGGIVGWNSDAASPIIDCTTSGTITAELITEKTNTPLSNYYCCAGGIVGFSKNKITNCTTSAHVSSFTNIISAETFAGGIAGGIFAFGQPITGCKVTGSVIANGESISLGGIIGFTVCDIIDCHTDALIIGGLDKNKHELIPSFANIGGLAGQMSQQSGRDETIRNCSVSGQISATGENCSIGGLAGENFGKIESSYTTVNISSEGTTIFAGGIAGQNQASQQGGCIQNCYSTGNITSSGETSNVGGIAGLNGDKVLNCFATGKVEAIHINTKTKSTPEGYVGGIVGMNKKNVENCLALNISGIANYATTTGRIIGNNDGSTTTVTTNNIAHPEIPGEWQVDQTDLNGSDWNYQTIPFNPSNAWDLTNTSQLPKLKKLNDDGSSYSDMVANQPSIPLLNLQFFTIVFDTPDNGTITVTPVGDNAISTGAKVSGGTQLTITAQPNNDTYQLDELLVNDVPFTSGNTLTVSEDITISATFSKSNPDPEPEPKPEPTPEPDPVPVYYLVTLPSIEGATTNPAAGDYEIEAWDSFQFYLTLDAAYSQSSPIVTTDRGETIEPRSSDGAYIIKYVRSDLQISIDGIVKNPDPVANESIRESSIKVWTTGSLLHIDTQKPETVAIYTFAGNLYKHYSRLSGDHTIRLPQGNYIVIVGDQQFKIQTRR